MALLIRSRAVAPIRFGLAAAVALAAATLTESAAAFCGFYVGGADAKLYNSATEVVLMREGTRTVLSMQNNYDGPPTGFAMVVPVPVILQKENVKTLPKSLFDKVDTLAAPRLVEYWEQDPCAVEPPYPKMSMLAGAAIPSAAPRSAAPMDLGVKVEAQFSVAEYEIVILSAKDSSGLDTWLRQEHYAIPAGAEAFLRPYVMQGSKFFVAKVDPSKVQMRGNATMLSPLRFHYDSENFTLPVRLGLMNAKGPQDLIVHILSRGGRYEVSNYPNVAIPTNFDVRESARANFGGFYASLFDRTLAQNPRAVVTEYSWDASSCDPCPGPTLDGRDLALLGDDVIGLGPTLVPANANNPGGSRPGAAPAASIASPSAPRRNFRGGGGFTLTRLHARYTQDSLGDDLHFQSAPAIVGGREFMRDGNALEQGARADEVNNFQGRYAIRHAWTGPVACQNPRRGRWGGPPGGAEPKAAAASDSAFAPRNLSLGSFAAHDVPGAQFLSAAGATPNIVQSTPAPLLVAGGYDADGGAVSHDADGGESSGGSVPAQKAGGCAGCASAPEPAAGGAGLVALLAVFAMRRRAAKRNIEG